jgi:amino acid adenylation domain-containing protein
VVPLSACAHELFEAQAARTPHAVAVVSGAERLTYRELDEQANQLAHYLRRRGIGTGSLVAVCMHRSARMVVALLGTWKAGAAYVPLDPGYPAERLAFMLEDSQARVLLTERSLRHAFPQMEDRTVVLDLHWPIVAQQPTGSPRADASPSDLAYVMYTSGSTGKPKGAMIPHGGLANYLRWAIDAYRVGPQSSVPVHSSISFDLTVTSLYPALLAGGEVELLPEKDAGVEALAAALRKKKRALVKITPAHLELLSRELAADEVAGMTDLFVIGGENLLAEHLRFWRERAPRTRLINEYGPTETVVGCCIHEVSATDPHEGSVPIGRAIANTQLHILGEGMRPVADGEMGELYIGGAGVGAGYLHRPDITSERFVDGMYRTGDLARLRPDGNLEYLGRCDDQVKIRGYRIELGEIEQALAAHPSVQSCAVIAREDEPGDRRLVGYVVSGAGASPQDLHEFLGRRLPGYMVPAQLVMLERLPITPNGKVDRKALPAPTREDAPAVPALVAARTQTERELAGIWASLLGIEAVGMDDDVFDLGAHSMMAMRAVVRIREAFEVNLQLRDLFERPTVGGLAELIDGVRLVTAAAEPARPGAVREEFSL